MSESIAEQDDSRPPDKIMVIGWMKNEETSLKLTSVAVIESLSGSCRKDKRKLLKKLKRKQIRKEVALKELAEEEARLNDPEEQVKVRLKEQEEAEILDRERKEFEEHERLWIEAATKAKEEAEGKRLEESQREQFLLETSGLHENELDKDDWEYTEEGPAEIIWQGNEIIVKKKRVKVAKKNVDQQPTEEDDNRPTSNPLPPQSTAFEAYKKTSAVSAQTMFESVAQQTPNFGTEQDKAHCPFHIKTGACRFGARCSRAHFYPDKSCTLLIKNMYNGPGLAWEQDEGLEYTDEEVERCYEEFYEDVHTEFLKFGEVINFKVCRNGSFHLRGNVYVHYKSLESAVLAYNSINGRYFGGKQITCEFVGVTRWKIAICGEYMKSRHKACSRGTACNFIHCFRNPGRDYEWADWDSPPPKYWVKKMAALFGPSEEVGYEKQRELECLEQQKKSSRRKTASRRRNRSPESTSGEMDHRHSNSDGELSGIVGAQRDRNSSRRKSHYSAGEFYDVDNRDQCDRRSSGRKAHYSGDEFPDKDFKDQQDRHRSTKKARSSSRKSEVDFPIDCEHHDRKNRTYDKHRSKFEPEKTESGESFPGEESVRNQFPGGQDEEDLNSSGSLQAQYRNSGYHSGDSRENFGNFQRKRHRRSGSRTGSRERRHRRRDKVEGGTGSPEAGDANKRRESKKRARRQSPNHQSGNRREYSGGNHSEYSGRSGREEASHKDQHGS